MEVDIALGPILGIENNCTYTVTFVSRHNLDESNLSLTVTSSDDEVSSDCVFNEKLYSSYFYKFSFEATPKQGSSVITYSIQLDGLSLENRYLEHNWSFVVPGVHEVPKIGFASCNGDSKRLPDEMTDTEFVMWDKLWEAHNKKALNYSFHCLLLGGDQVYADPIWEKISYFKDNGLLKWLSTNKAIRNHVIESADKDVLESEIATFYENLYFGAWGKRSVSRVMASIPSIMMWDDHDIFDGWGSHPDDLQKSEVFQLIFKVAKNYFHLLQIRGNNTSLTSQDHFSMHVPFRNYEILILDNRTHRSGYQVMSPQQYSELEAIKNGRLFDQCPDQQQKQKVLLFVIPVPVAHLNYKKKTEKWLRRFATGNFRSSLNDDGLDHWDHGKHANEQKQLIDMMYEFGDKHNPRYIHIVSGDVHSAGSGKIVKEDPSSRKVINQMIASPIVFMPINWVVQMFLNLVADSQSIVKGYKVGISTFGLRGKPQHKIIYERNFGFFYKAQKSGIKYYLTTEKHEQDYQSDQPESYIG